MKHKINHGISIMCIFFILLTGCKKADKYYLSPNDPTSATLQTLMTSLQVSTINSYEGDFARTAGMLVQHGVGVDGQATQINGYSLSENQFDNQWSQVYQNINTGYELLKISEGDNSSPRYSGIAKIVLAMNWGILTDLWGDIPFSEAVNSEIKFPQYDSQESVYTGIQDLLSDGIADLQSTDEQNAVIPGSDDVIFAGDAELWTKTAWTLKARYWNRLSKKPEYNPTNILDALSKGIISTDEDCMSPHGVGDNDHNQWYDYLRERMYITAAKPLVDSLLLRPTDTRISYYFDKDDNGSFTGSPVDVPNPDVSYWGTYLAAGTDTYVPLVTYFEALFIKAEVLARQADAGAANALNEAIKASASKVTKGTYDGASIATYTSANIDLSRVMYEKWLAMFGQVETYTDYRRTGYPAITPNPQGVTEGKVIPRRLPTPLTERTGNINAPTPKVTEAVWFAE